MRHHKENLRVVWCRTPSSERLKAAIWGIGTGVATGVSVGWLAEAPWISHRIAQLVSWLAALQVI
jgi:hypothetical protein